MDEQQQKLYGRIADRQARGVALCVWRVHHDGTRSLMATPVDDEYADRLAVQLRSRGMDIEIVEQPAPYRHTSSERLWDGELGHPVLDEQLSRYTDGPFDRASSASLAMDWLPTDELLRIIRNHAAAGAPDDDTLALLQETLRLRSREAACRRHTDQLGGALATVAACLYRADPDLCRQALEQRGFSLHDLFAFDLEPTTLCEEWIDELVEEARDGQR